MAISSMKSRAVSLSFESYVLDAVHHWKKWNASSFCRGFLNIGLCRGCLVRVSVLVVGVYRQYPADQWRKHDP